MSNETERLQQAMREWLGRRGGDYDDVARTELLNIIGSASDPVSALDRWQPPESEPTDRVEELTQQISPRAWGQVQRQRQREAETLTREERHELLKNLSGGTTLAELRRETEDRDQAVSPEQRAAAEAILAPFAGKTMAEVRDALERGRTTPDPDYRSALEAFADTKDRA